MARPQRNNVDYFPHYISDGKKMFIIESKYGNDGYAVWFKILETLAKSDNHWIDLSDKSNLMYLAAKCRISDNLLCDIISSLADLSEVDSLLWEHERVIWSDKFIESIADAYVKRSNNAPTKPDLLHLLRGLGRCKHAKLSLKGSVKPQSIVKDSILNKTKEDDTPKHPIIIWIEDKAPRVAQMKIPLNNQSAKNLLIDLDITSDAKKERLKNVITAMQNRPNLLTNNLDANLTIRNWWKREMERETPTQPLNAIKMNDKPYTR